ncbi:MAG: UMP kinase [Patescibacteria group bacterium]|jgi:uridylate kinase
MNTIIISLGGSLIFNEVTKQPSVERIRIYSKWLKRLSAHQRVIVVVGGGIPARQYITAGKTFTKSSAQLDELGIAVSRINAHLLQLACGQSADKKIISDPRVILPKQKKIFIGAGWKPGRSTDYDAVMLAVKNKVDTVYNLSNITYLYNKDPKKYSAAVKITDITWPDLQLIIGKTWQPGLNVPFDPIAAQLAAKHKLTVKIMNGQKVGDLKHFVGTVIHS